MSEKLDTIILKTPKQWHLHTQGSHSV